MALSAIFGVLLAVTLAVESQLVDISPREAVRRVGDDLTVFCKVPYPIDSCRVTVGTTSYRLIPNNQEEEVTYSGQGLEAGECGAHIKHVREEWNGNISCTLPPQTGSIELSASMRLLVAKAPGVPQLVSPPQPTFREGDGFVAQCIVPDGRPAAKITWYFDEVQLMAGVHQPVVTSRPGSDLTTILQNVSRTLTPDDNGKKLVCRAEHEALDSPREVARQLVVNYPPKRLEAGPITIFGLKLGAEGRLNVTVRASPAPRAQWTLGELVLEPPRTTDGVSALEPVALGGGYYNMTLVLERVSKDDVARSIGLRVLNELGQEDFVVRLSTMDEPPGVELGVGGVVGIVVAALLLVVAAALLVFARATDRWCFAGNRGRDHKSSGESSDTESAAGARGRLAALTARVRAALPKKTEKHSEEVHDEASEEKKGVVYAELALGDQTGDRAPPPPATEYAEIVYNTQEQAKEGEK
ncbi:fasciclin-3 isoform X1 [Danaus plexippus]|uniref:fasciclin-3 isoform X1 n=1 Tax=Danaus plexippus TaxID=13037 RepID=UPI002AAF6CB0|nr:fasciclin-3 isoform X1 [Danaus plexippus]